MTKLHEDLRKELSVRFKAVIKYLMEKGIVQKSSQNAKLSYSDLAAILFGDCTNLSTLSATIRGHRLADFTESIILADTFGINTLWMVTGKGDMLPKDSSEGAE